MKIFLDKSKLKDFIRDEHNLGFVPTMGAIHKGHISLIEKSKKSCSKTIVSIFVNKPQFNNKKDYIKYPRILTRDISILRKLKTDILYLPRTNQIYPQGPNKKIVISPFQKQLCGKFRPGHFKAIVDVIDRFIKIIKPKRIYLGEKDKQQLEIIRDFINKNHIYTKVIGCKTIRENNGVAYSSRNLLLTKKQKFIASNIYKTLVKDKIVLIKKKALIKKYIKKVKKLGADHVDYIKVINLNRIFKNKNKQKKYKIFIAYYLGKIRLIDNF
jgi:pantoate--beta-alanine ligase